MVGMVDSLQQRPVAGIASWDQPLPFRIGDTGPGVVDMQQRLQRLEYPIAPDALGALGEGTERAIRAFQQDRGLRVDGVCGRQTWSSLVEAGYRLGDRVLYQRMPMLHGDDVAELQRKLSAFGFDPGGVDGIFGDLTGSALADFQHNIGITNDGIFGPRTLTELLRLSVRTGADDPVTTVREQLRVSRGPATLRGRTIAVGEPGGFAVGAGALVRLLDSLGAEGVPFHHPDEAEQATAANSAGVDCYIGLRLAPEHPGVRTFYYRGFRYESAASHALADLIAAEVTRELQLPLCGAEGMALPILRLTRMPAVVVELGAPADVAMRAPDLASAICAALARWITREAS
jgi:N-acetylmuramoyl-L-alanine amidase